MSADTLQQKLGNVIPPHLTVEPDSRVAPDLEVDAEKGLFYCVRCDRRVTKNSHNGNEYGHDTDCEHHTFAGVVWQ